MAVYDLEEQEQIAQIKAWWEQHGNLVVTVLLAAALVFAAWAGWRRYQDGNAAEAGALYAELQQAAAMDNTQQVRELAGRLIEKYDGTLHAQLGALLSSSVQFRKNELDNARLQLEWAANKGKDAELRELARLRLATVLLQQGAVDEALACLQPAPKGVWRARFEDLRGDAFAAQGKTGEARAAWRAALDALDALDASDGDTLPLRGVIRAKLESLEG
ncbi:MAG: tetratricopeptide repeat protein [Azoarcus sp.]|jgi:predicted negative regulator of RcsB-dependent stress response|nr:tetratricopeptide repeat protein [Azoarcus sp.]